MNPHTIRLATISDVAVIARHRVCMFRDMGQVPSDALAAELLEASMRVLGELLRAGAYVGWLAIDAGGQVLAGAGVHVKPQLPRMAADGGAVDSTALPLVVNVYTEPQVRGRGIARSLMHAILAWAATQGFNRVLLHAAEAGRPLYASLGFVATNEMSYSPAAIKEPRR